MFGRNYHCCTTPPYQRARDILKRYDHFRWFWIGKDCQDRIDDMMAREDLGSSDYITHKLALTQVNAVILGKIRKDCEMLKSYFREKKRAFKLFGPGGGCTKCKPCGKLKEPREPCAHPDTTQGSAEGFGIDVYASLKKAGIEIQIPPMTYLMTVGMIAWSE
jgi:predicted metal-binding protein